MSKKKLEKKMDNNSNYNNVPSDEKTDIIVTDNGAVILQSEVELPIGSSAEPQFVDEGTILDKPIEGLSDENKQYIDEIIQKWEMLDFYTQEREDILKTINQYNGLCVQAKAINDEYSALLEETLLANKEYDNLKRNFAQIVEDAQWGEKLFYMMPVIDDLDSNSQWDNLWCEVVKKSTEESCPRLYIKNNLYSCVFTLPKDVYFYKVKEDKLDSLSETIVKATRVLASKMVLMFKNITNLSDSLRGLLVKLLSNKLMTIPENVILPKKEELTQNLTFLRSIVENNEENIDRASILLGLYNNFNSIPEDLLSGDYNKFISCARNLYQSVQLHQSELNSIKKDVYSRSITDLFKLYDSIKKCHEDYLNLVDSFEESDAEGLVYCNNIIDMLNKLLAEIENYLKKTLGLIPLTIEVGINFNKYPIDYYEVVVAEDAPNETLKECVSSIMDTGFAKYDENGKFLFVAKPARIAVYSNIVVS